jgi:hypothetical protein
MVFVLGRMIGSTVQVRSCACILWGQRLTTSQVQLMNGGVYFGVMHGVDVSGGRLSVALRMAHFKPCPDPESKSGGRAHPSIVVACVLKNRSLSAHVRVACLNAAAPELGSIRSFPSYSDCFVG